MKSRLLWLLVAVVVIAIVAWVALSKSKPVEVELSTAAVGPLVSPFTAEGTIKGNSVDIEPETSGRVLAILVREGDTVFEGEPLVRLQSADLSAAVAQATAALHSARERQSQAEHAYNLAKRNSAARIEQARVSKRAAESNLALVLAGARPEEVAQLEQRVKQAETAETQAKVERDRMQRLYDQGAVPLADLQRAKTAHESAIAETAVAKEALAIAKNGPTPEQRSAARAAVEVAQANLDAAIAGQEEVDVAEHELSAARDLVQQAQASLAAANSALDRATVKAPFAGSVSYVPTKVGDMAMPGRTLLTLVGQDVLTIEAEIGDQDFSKVSVGQGVDVTSASMPGETYKGVVSRIADEAVQKPGTQLRTRILRVTIALDSTVARFRPGMEVDVHGEGTVAERAITIPSRALVTSGEDRSVWIFAGGTVRKTQVTIGALTFESVQVTAGLKEGDQVVVSPPADLKDGQRVQKKGA